MLLLSLLEFFLLQSSRFPVFSEKAIIKKLMTAKNSVFPSLFLSQEKGKVKLIINGQVLSHKGDRLIIGLAEGREKVNLRLPQRFGCKRISFQEKKALVKAQVITREQLEECLHQQGTRFTFFLVQLNSRLPIWLLTRKMVLMPILHSQPPIINEILLI